MCLLHVLILLESTYRHQATIDDEVVSMEILDTAGQVNRNSAKYFLHQIKKETCMICITFKKKKLRNFSGRDFYMPKTPYLPLSQHFVCQCMYTTIFVRMTLCFKKVLEILQHSQTI